MPLKRRLKLCCLHVCSLIVLLALAGPAHANLPFAGQHYPQGAEDFVSLVKEITDLDKDQDKFEKFQTRGGVMDGEALTPERVTEISKWPTREEQLSLLVGQILGPGAQLSAQLIGPGGQLASQVKQVSEEKE